VIEFADGRMDTAKKPLPRPPKPEKKSAGEKPAAEGETATTAVDPAGEVPVLTEAEIPASEPEPAVEPEPAAEATAETPAPAEPAADVPAIEPAADAAANAAATDDNPSLS
jgi:ubiquinol-cytochrome c reductase cytochrome c1 subunit